MSLIDQIQALSTRIGNEFTAVRTEMAQANTPFGAMVLRNTNTTTNVYTTNATQIPIGGIVTSYGTGFTQAGNAIRTNFQGFVKITGSLHLEQPGPSADIRLALALEYYRNTNSLGIRFNTNYIRNGSGHDEASSTGGGFVTPCNNGDLFSLFGLIEGNPNGNLVMTSGRSYLMVERVA